MAGVRGEVEEAQKKFEKADASMKEMGSAFGAAAKSGPDVLRAAKTALDEKNVRSSTCPLVIGAHGLTHKFGNGLTCRYKSIACSKLTIS